MTHLRRRGGAGPFGAVLGPLLVLAALLVSPLPASAVGAEPAEEATRQGSSEQAPSRQAPALQTPASPEPDPTAEESSNPTPQPIAVTFDSPAPDAFVTTGRTPVSGTATPGSTVVVTTIGSRCEVEADDGGAWACSVAVSDGADVKLTATATLAGESAEASVAVDALSPPSIDPPGGTPSTGLVRGSAYPGATILVSVEGGEPRPCPPADSTGFWSCALVLPDGAATFTATQQVSSIGDGRSSAASVARSILIDRTAPAAPAVLSPAAEAQLTGDRVVVSGSGEPAGLVDVYFDGELVCSARVLSDGSWRCTASMLPSAGWLIQAIQRDEAGNYSSPGGGVRITVVTTDAETDPSASPSASPSSPGDDASASPSASATPTPGAAAPPPGGSDDPGRLSRALPGIAQVATTGTWAFAFAVAAGFVALIALPLGVLLARRGQSRDRAGDTDPRIGRVVGAAGGIAVVTIAASGVTTGADAGLLLATTAGLAALTLLPALAAWTLALVLDARVSVRLLPAVLLAAMVCALVSRVTGLDPPLLIGVVLAAVVLEGDRRASGVIAITQLAVIAGVAIVAWLFHQVSAPLGGTLATITNDALAVTTIGGLVALPLLALPVPGLPGHALFAWSRGTWLGAALASVFLAASVLAQPGAATPPAALLLTAGVAAAVVVAAALLIHRLPKRVDAP